MQDEDEDRMRRVEEHAQQAAQANDVPRCDGWIMLAVQFLNDSSAMFRIEWHHAYRPPERSDEESMLFDHDGSNFSLGVDTLSFAGEKLDREKAEWTEKCAVRIPAQAYTMASWKFYRADDPKWRIPKPEDKVSGLAARSFQGGHRE